MGFRHPVRTISDEIDTAEDDWPGVRLFQENPGNLATARGVAEWRPGTAVMPEAVPARAEVVPFLIAQPGNPIDRSVRWRHYGPAVSIPPLVSTTPASVQYGAERAAATGDWSSFLEIDAGSLGRLSVTGDRIQDLGAPTAATDAATKGYVDRGMVARGAAATFSTNASGDFTVTHNFLTNTGLTPVAMGVWPRVAGANSTHTFAITALAANTATVRTYFGGAVLPNAAGVGVYFVVLG